MPSTRTRRPEQKRGLLRSGGDGVFQQVRTRSRGAGERPRGGVLGFLQRPEILALALFAAVVLVSRVAVWNTPLQLDAGQYLYIGDVILDGGTPYVDAANNKGPAMYVLFALISFLSGSSVLLARLSLVVVTALAAWALAGYVGRRAGREVGFVAGLAFALISGAAAVGGFEMWSETYAIAPMAGALYFSVRPGARSAALTGACATFAMLMNPIFGLIVPVAAIELWQSNSAARARVRALGLATAAGLVLAVPFLIWLGLAGALDDMRTQILGHVSRNVAGGSGGGEEGGGFAPAPPIEASGSETSWFFDLTNIPLGALWIAAAIGFVLAWKRPATRLYVLPMGLLAALVWLRVQLSDYWFFHHYFIALPAVAVGIALGIASIWGDTFRSKLATTALVLTVPVAALVLGPQWSALQTPAEQRLGAPSLALADDAADAVRERTGSDEKIIVAGTRSQVYWLAKRRAASRFFDTFPLQADEGYRQQREDDLLGFPPRAVVILPGQEVDSTIRALLQQEPYELVWQESGARLWLLPNS